VTSHRERDGLSDEVAVGNTSVADEAPAGANGSGTRRIATRMALSDVSGNAGRNGAVGPAYVTNDDGSEGGNAVSSDDTTACAF
jgi:hypothetical protein